jgi:hypothetical protein
VIEVQNGVITPVGRRGSFPVAAAVRHIDVTARTIMPALINVHTHLASVRPPPDGAVMAAGGIIERNADRYLFYRITRVLSLGTDGEAMDGYRHDEDLKPMTGAHVLLQAMVRRRRADGRGRTRTCTVRRHRKKDARPCGPRCRATSTRSSSGSDSDHGRLPQLTPDVYGAVIDEAHRHRLKAFCHVFGLEDSKELIRRGVDVLAHSIRDKAVDEGFLKLAKERGTVARRIVLRS